MSESLPQEQVSYTDPWTTAGQDPEVKRLVGLGVEDGAVVEARRPIDFTTTVGLQGKIAYLGTCLEVAKILEDKRMQSLLTTTESPGPVPQAWEAEVRDQNGHILGYPGWMNGTPPTTDGARGLALMAVETAQDELMTMPAEPWLGDKWRQRLYGEQ